MEPHVFQTQTSTDEKRSRGLVRADGTYRPIVSELQFRAAREIIDARSYRIPDEEMLRLLKTIHERCGCLSGLIIDEAEGCPSSSAYKYRFGSLLRCYSLIGYTPGRDYQYLEANRRLRLLHPGLLQQTIEQIRAVGGRVDVEAHTGMLAINQEIRLSVVLCRCQFTSTGARRWKIRFDLGLGPDLTVAVRMNEGEERAIDYYVLPTVDMTVSQLRVAENNRADVEIYRFDSLEIIAQLSRRSAYRRAA